MAAYFSLSVPWGPHTERLPVLLNKNRFLTIFTRAPPLFRKKNKTKAIPRRSLRTPPNHLLIPGAAQDHGLSLRRWGAGGRAGAAARPPRGGEGAARGRAAGRGGAAAAWGDGAGAAGACG